MKRRLPIGRGRPSYQSGGPFLCSSLLFKASLTEQELWQSSFQVSSPLNIFFSFFLTASLKQIEGFYLKLWSEENPTEAKNNGVRMKIRARWKGFFLRFRLRSNPFPYRMFFIRSPRRAVEWRITPGRINRGFILRTSRRLIIPPNFSYLYIITEILV